MYNELYTKQIGELGERISPLITGEINIIPTTPTNYYTSTVPCK